MIRYFVSYTMQNAHSFGSGNCELHLTRPIESMTDVNDVTALLRNNGISNPVVMSFTRFDANNGVDGGATR